MISRGKGFDELIELRVPVQDFICRNKQLEVTTSSCHDYSKPIFERQPHIIICMAFINGSYEGGVRIAVPTIQQVIIIISLYLISFPTALVLHKKINICLF